MGNNAITKNLIDYLHINLNKIQSLDIIVSFIQNSGLNLIKPLLIEAKNKDIDIRIITSTYMNITDPTALLELYYLLDNDSVHLYNGNAPSFHPKAYMFKGININDSCIFIGSSNISKVALTKGVEWNYCIEGNKNPDAIKTYMEEFDYIYNYESYTLTKETIEEYRTSYILPMEFRNNTKLNLHFRNNKRINYNNQSNIINNIADGTTEYIIDSNISELYSPNEAQKEALLELQNTRVEGNEKALVVAATGIGKTFLAAFDSEKFNSILFIAHREEILNQAYNTFAKVRKEIGFGRFYKNNKDYKANILFASIQSLNSNGNFKIFNNYQFDYIIIDEIHHGTAPIYKRIINYFKPKFMLGLTATPHRLDKKSVYEICDFNSVYEVDLFSAINRGWLVPYKYYGIYDATVNYDNVLYLNGKYVEKELEKALSINERAELILKNYLKYKRKRTLAFCTSIKHAEYMATYFNDKGIKSICIHSDSNQPNYCERNEGIKRLKEGKVDIIFSVDMLNEGVDIPSIDLLLFLRPTQSPVVFLQQLGRGLRIAENKKALIVLDFIGNFKKVELIPFLLSKKGISKNKLIKGLKNGDYLPFDCQVDFDFEVVDLLEKAINSKMKIRDKIRDWYFEAKAELEAEKSLSRIEFFKWLDDLQYQSIKKHTKLNPFKNYINFLYELGESHILKDFLNTDEYYFINFIENTSMTQLYKLPVILSFISDNEIKTSVTKEEIVKSFKDFYSNNRNLLDLTRNKSTKSYKNFSDNDWWKLAKNNPIKYLCKTSGDIFEFDSEKLSIKLNFFWINNDTKKRKWFIEEIIDCIEFRRNEFLDQRIERKNKI